MNFTDRLHNLLDDDFEARACKDIEDEACKVVPGNYFLLLISLILSKLADTFASAKIVLPWLMINTGAPVYLISLLVPIRESGSMLPQLILGAYIRQKPIRKVYLVMGSILQALCIVTLAVVAINLSGVSAGITIVVLTIFFSLARAISSIANKDVIGKAIPKKQRGRLSGAAASYSGFISIAFGVLLMFGFAVIDNASYLLFAAVLCFALSAVSFALIKEYSGATSGGVKGIQVAVENLRLMRTDSDFSRFVLVRALMICSGLAAPYFVLLSQAEQNTSLQSLGMLILISGIASFISGHIWGRMADNNSKNLITVTAVLNGVICLFGALASVLISANAYIFLGLFFCLSIVHEGVRQGRKTYVVDMAGGNKRTDYVSVSNTLIGLWLLLFGLLTGLLAQFSVVATMLFFSALSCAAALLSLSLKSVSH